MVRLLARNGSASVKGELRFFNERAYPGMVLFSLHPPTGVDRVEGLCPLTSLQAFCGGFTSCLDVPQRSYVAAEPGQEPRVIERDPIRLRIDEEIVSITYPLRFGTETCTIRTRDFCDTVVALAVARSEGPSLI